MESKIGGAFLLLVFVGLVIMNFFNKSERGHALTYGDMQRIEQERQNRLDAESLKSQGYTIIPPGR